MKETQQILEGWRIYSKPEIVRIRLDNEISLALESDPPFPENESMGTLRSDYFDDNPVKTAG